LIVNNEKHKLQYVEFCFETERFQLSRLREE
jgi:hypothetical protein